MLRDISTVAWKELKELLYAMKNTGSVVRLLIWLGIFGFMFPFQSAAIWQSALLPAIYWAWLAFFLGSGIASGAFARERELNTLETLLASRLSDQAILFGKIAGAVAYTWGMVMITYLMGIAALSLKLKRLTFFAAGAAISGPLLSLLAAVLVAVLGALISLKASTSVQAQQTMGWVSMILFLPVMAVQFIPAAQTFVLNAMTAVQPALIIAVVGVVLLAADVILTAATMSRFKRAQLILL